MAVGGLHHAAGASSAGGSPGSRISQLQNGRRCPLQLGDRWRRRTQGAEQAERRRVEKQVDGHSQAVKLGLMATMQWKLLEN